MERTAFFQKSGKAYGQIFNRCLLKKNPAKFHPDPIRNGAALGFLDRSSQQQEEQEQIRDARILSRVGALWRYITALEILLHTYCSSSVANSAA